MDSPLMVIRSINNNESESLILNYIPDGFRNADFSNFFYSNEGIVNPKEGDCVVGEVLSFDVFNRGLRNHFHLNGKIISLKPLDIIPLILTFRKSLMEFSGEIPEKVNCGDVLQILGGDGYVGKFIYGYLSYGIPINVKIVGTIVKDNSENINTQNFSFPLLKHIPNLTVKKPFVISIMGTRMDVGKTTTAIKIVKGMTNFGLSSIGGKLTGFGCRYEVTNLSTENVVDFTDYGLTSTCGPDKEKVIETAKKCNV